MFLACKRAFIFFLLAFMGFMGGGTSSVRADNRTSREYDIKAAFLYRITHYVEWPASSPQGDFIIGVLGENPFKGSLTSMVEGKTVHGRPIVLLQVSDLGQYKFCHVLFISRSHAAQVKDVLKKTKGHSTLLVADSKDMAVRGCAINFYIGKGRVRFEINIEAARRARLKISAKLLSLARMVEEAL